MSCCQSIIKKRRKIETYVAGNCKIGIAPIVTIKLPNAYTKDTYRMVLNFPSQLSDMIAPKTLMKADIETNA